MLVINIISIVLMTYVPFNMIWYYVQLRMSVEAPDWFTERVARFTVATIPSKRLHFHCANTYSYLFSFVFAVIIVWIFEKLSLFRMFLTAFYIPIIVVAFPPMMDFCVRFPDDLGRFKWRAVLDIFTMIFGVALLGCVIQMKVYYELYEYFSSPDGIYEYMIHS